MSEWISVEDRLPPLGQRVFVAATRPAAPFAVGYMDGSDWGIWWEYDLTEEEIDPREDGLVTHWMPLPTPPAEREQ